jgi:hypothetical protein
LAYKVTRHPYDEHAQGESRSDLIYGKERKFKFVSRRLSYFAL